MQTATRRTPHCLESVVANGVPRLVLKRRLIACAYSWFSDLLLAGSGACSQICMLNSPVPGEHLENQSRHSKGISTGWHAIVIQDCHEVLMNSSFLADKVHMMG